MLAMKPVVYESLFSNKTVFGRQTPFKAWTEWNIPQKTRLSHDQDPGFRDIPEAQESFELSQP